MDPFSERSLPNEAKMYLASLQLKGRQPATLNRYAYDLEDFFMWLRAGEKPFFSEISSGQIEDYLAFLENQKSYSKRTIDRVITVLNRFYAHVHELGMAVNNPVAGISFEKHEEDARFTDKDFICDEEADSLFQSIPSSHGLSENQKKSRIYLSVRNLAIITLFLHYGLTLAELTGLKMRNARFERKQLSVSSTSSHSRTIELDSDDEQLLFSYYGTIPKAVRPRLHSDEPLFVAFDFQRNTYRWDYATDAPKALTEIAVQKMIRQEVARAGLRKGISAQHLRRTYILRMIQEGESLETVQQKSGLKTKLALKRYKKFAET